MSCWAALSSVISLGRLLHTLASFASNQQSAVFFFLNFELLLLSVSVRSALLLPPVLHRCSLQMLTDFLIRSFCSPGPHLANLFICPSIPCTNSGSLLRAPWSLAIQQGAGTGEVVKHPALFQWDLSPGPSAGEYTPHTQESLCLTYCQLPCLCVLPVLSGFFIFLRELLFVQVFKTKSACNLILLGKNIIYKSLFLLSSSLAFVARIYMYVHLYTYV